REGRRLPEDDEAFAIVHGTLRADAAVSDAGVSLSIAVEGLDGRNGQEGLERQEGQERPGGREGHEGPEQRSAKASAERNAKRPIGGGVIVTVGGTLAPERMKEWRAGRRVRVPVQLHRAARYLDPGVPDHERALARRGTTLVGTVKSGALVEVVARGSFPD